MPEHRRPARTTRSRVYPARVAYDVEVRPGTTPLWLYLRLSKYHATVDGSDAIERHRLDLTRLLADGPYTVVGEFCDNDSASAYAARQRKGWLALNEGIDAGEVTAVAFYALARVSRTMVEQVQWLDRCREMRVKLISYTDSADELTRATGAAKMVSGVKALVSEIESDTASERQLASKAHAAEAGFFHGGTVPLGWQRGEREIDQHGRSGTRLVPHPVEFPALQSAVAWAIEGDSMATVARRWLDEFGISSADGQPIYQASVLRALRSPRLMGYRLRQVPEHERQKKINLLDYIVRDAHGDPVISQEPVCDRGTWNRLQAVLSQRSNIGTRRPWGSHDWLLSGLMFCGICQARMYGAQKINKGGDKSFYYRCNANRVRGVGTCEGMGINGPNAEAYALGWIVEHLTPERLSEAAIRLAARQERSDPREAALADARAERDLLLARQQSGEFRGPLLGSMLDMLVDAQRRIDQLEDQVAQDELSPPGMTGEDLLESWPDLTIERRRHIVRRVVKRIEVSKGRGPVEDRLEVTGTW